MSHSPLTLRALLCFGACCSSVWSPFRELCLLGSPRTSFPRLWLQRRLVVFHYVGGAFILLFILAFFRDMETCWIFAVNFRFIHHNIIFDQVSLQYHVVLIQWSFTNPGDLKPLELCPKTYKVILVLLNPKTCLGLYHILLLLYLGYVLPIQGSENFTLDSSFERVPLCQKSSGCRSKDVCLCCLFLCLLL